MNCQTQMISLYAISGYLRIVIMYFSIPRKRIQN